MLPGGSIGCLYEGGEKNAYERIVFARFSLETLDQKNGADDAVIKEITGFKLPPVARLAGFRRTKPTVIENRPSLVKIFTAEALPRIDKQVDIGKQVLVFFRWSGSGQDRLTYTIQKQAAKTKVVFSHRRGRTRDLRRHARLFAIGRHVTWEVSK